MNVINILDKKIQDLVMGPAVNLDELLIPLVKNAGGKEILGREVEVYEIHNYNGFSGYNYWIEQTLVGQLHLAILSLGGFVFYKRTFINNVISESYHYYDVYGKFLHSSPSLDGQVLPYNNTFIDITSPFLNQFYNILKQQYELAKEAKSKPMLMHSLEILILQLFENNDLNIGVKAMAKDPAILNIEEQMIRVEMSPVLTWEERQKVFETLKEERAIIIQTKKRVHNFSYMQYVLPIKIRDLQNAIKIIKQRPIDNIKGIIYKYTIGNFIWFVSTVKRNLGYSVALAIYGPFTFYFITQPMNPHAMWAVGKVRSAYVNALSAIEESYNSMIDDLSEIKKDEISTIAAAQDKSLSSIQFIQENPVDWTERMNQFKDMQIGYEGSLVASARLGRLEQLESQFTFPLTSESAWLEINRYINDINGTLQFNTNLDPAFKAYLENELKRANENKIYIWKKLAQFFVDNMYIVMDKSHEQPKRDFYVGRSFLFMEKITKEIALNTPEKLVTSSGLQFSTIQELAREFSKQRKLAKTTLEKLENNSALFGQKDLFDSETFRDNIKRHWEVVFLVQNKAQEASNFGLQSYMSSIRTTLWSIQTIYGIKRAEIGSLLYKYNLNNQNVGDVFALDENNDLLESIMHLMVFDYVGIRKEMTEALNHDPEVKLRDGLILSFKDYINERDALFLKANKK